MCSSLVYVFGLALLFVLFFQGFLFSLFSFFFSLLFFVFGFPLFECTDIWVAVACVCCA